MLEANLLFYLIKLSWESLDVSNGNSESDKPNGIIWNFKYQTRQFQ